MHEKQILVQWVGPHDLVKPSLGKERSLEGAFDHREISPRDPGTTRPAFSPLHRLTQENAFDHVVLLSPFPADANDGLADHHPSVEIVPVQLTDDEDFLFILRIADKQLQSTHDRYGPNARIALNLSSGTGVMVAIWLYLSHTKYPATLYRVSAEGKCLRVELPENASTTWSPCDGHREGAHPLGNGFDLEQHLNQLRCRYLHRAMEESRGVKAHAAKLLGMKHYQTLSAQLERFAITGNWHPPTGDGKSAKS